MRRGSVYVIVVLLVALVSVLGLSAVNLASSRATSLDDRRELVLARLRALSGIERGVVAAKSLGAVDDVAKLTDIINETPTGTAVSYTYLDRSGSTEVDLDLGAWIYGRGEAGGAVWVERARLRVDEGRPLAPLRTALHATDGISVLSGAQIKVLDGPVSCDGAIVNEGRVTGPVEAKALSGSGQFSQSNDPSRGAKGMIHRDIFDRYQRWASEMTFDGDVDGELIAPGVCSYGLATTNAEGIYYLKTNGDNLLITNTRIASTLVIDARPGGVVTIGQGTTIEAPFAGRPALLVKGELVIDGAGASVVSESIRNLNPDGAPFEGESDNDQADTYSRSIRGLVHVFGRARLLGNARIIGSLVVDGSVVVEGSDIRIQHDPKLLRHPPRGAGEDPDSKSFVVVPGSWEHIGVGARN